MEAKLWSDGQKSHIRHFLWRMSVQHNAKSIGERKKQDVNVADRVMENVSKFIQKKLGLKVNMTKSKVSKSNDIKYLGFGFYYDNYYKLWKAKPHEISIKKLKEKLRRLTNRSWSVSWSNSRKSYARCAQTILNSVLTKELLYRKGLPSMIVQYQLKHILV